MGVTGSKMVPPITKKISQELIVNIAYLIFETLRKTGEKAYRCESGFVF